MSQIQQMLLPLRGLSMTGGLLSATFSGNFAGHDSFEGRFAHYKISEVISGGRRSQYFIAGL